MTESVEITVSSNLSSANASSAISNHSGKANRMRFEHTNPDIDKTRTQMNVELDPHDRETLLMQHYGDLIEKHNRQNNSAARHWDLKKYLETFEGKTIKAGGKETRNKRWATATQISYLGGKDSLNPILEEIEAAGAKPEEICAAYASGYAEYVQKHNETFPTLPIYHSDIHFDETTPHGHDAIVVKGHTEKGRPSDSINNALGEKYGYGKTFEEKKENMEKYRKDNDEIMFMSIAPKLEALGAAYGIDFKFEMIRTEQKESLDYKTYKKTKDLEAMDTEYKMNLKVQKDSNAKIRERDQKSAARSAALDIREDDVAAREGRVIAQMQRLQEKDAEDKIKDEKRIAFDKHLDKREEALVDRKTALLALEQRRKEEEQRLNKLEKGLSAVALGIYASDPKFKKMYDKIEEHGVTAYEPESLINHLTQVMKAANQGKLAKPLHDEKFIKQKIAEREAQDQRHQGPEL